MCGSVCCVRDCGWDVGWERWKCGGVELGDIGFWCGCIFDERGWNWEVERGENWCKVCGEEVGCGWEVM